MILKDSGLRFMDSIIWVKSGPNFTVLRNAHILKNKIYYPTFQWEAFLVFQKEGSMPRMTYEGAKYMNQFISNVWEFSPISNSIEKMGHKDPLPIEFPYRFIQAYTQKNATILDPFGGSGTTLIAAEKAGRQAFLIERMPKFCDIAIARWEKLTGKKAERL